MRPSEFGHASPKLIPTYVLCKVACEASRFNRLTPKVADPALGGLRELLRFRRMFRCRILQSVACDCFPRRCATKGIPFARVRVEKSVMDAKVLIPFQQNVTALLDSIEDCLTKGRTIACLILLYSGIDCISALETGRANRSRFRK